MFNLKSNLKHQCFLTYRDICFDHSSKLIFSFVWLKLASPLDIHEIPLYKKKIITELDNDSHIHVSATIIVTNLDFTIFFLILSLQHNI